MTMLPTCVVRWLCWASLFLGAAGQGTSTSSTGESQRCFGKCVSNDELCEHTAGMDTCGKGLKCCLDEAKVSTPESTEAFTYDPIVEAEMRIRSFLDSSETDYSTGSTMMYGDFDYPSLDPSAENPDGPLKHDGPLKCPGMCMSLPHIKFCGHPFPFGKLCSGNDTCCLSEIQAFKVRTLYRQNTSEVGGVSEGTAEILRIFQAGDFGNLNDVFCPYNCILPQNFVRCKGFYLHLYCPGRSKCCIEDTTIPIPAVKACSGRCVPPHLYFLCKSPRTLQLSPSCRIPTLCCELDTSTAMQYPASSDGQSYVPPEGRSAQLTDLPPDSSEFQDSSGFEESGQGYMVADPETASWEYGPQMAESSGFFRNAENSFRVASPEESVSDEIIIDDEETVDQEKEGWEGRPPCPGTCLSYIGLTRLLCRGNYTTYDGFLCPERSVCCAKLDDIKKYEDELKSMYPYLQSNLRTLNPNCGKKGRVEETAESLPGEWCWQVAIIDEGNNYVCGGVLIEKSWAITSGQCVEGYITQNQPLFVRAGVTDLGSLEYNAVSQTRRVSNMYLHVDYDASSMDNDIALLKLQDPFSFNANICEVCLPSSRIPPREGTMCTVTGYAFLSSEGMHFRMKEAEVPLVHDLDCIANLTAAILTVYLLPASSFCAGHEKDYCQGAAGNPLVCKVDDHYELMGLFSWGVGCESVDSPSVYVKIPALMGWINHVIATDHQLNSAPPGSY